MNSFLPYFANVLIMSLGVLSFAQTNSDNVKSVDSPPPAIWKDGQENGFLGLRSNAPHWWSYFKTNGDIYFESSWIVDGLVIGDTHMFNMGTIINQDQYLLSPIDLDDSGIGATISDITRYVTSERVNPDGISIKEIMTMYKKGLTGEQITKPKWLTGILSKPQQSVKSDTSVYLDKKTKNFEKLNNKELEVEGPKNWKPSISAIWSQIQSQLQTKFPGIQILDVGFRTRTTGGISGMGRFMVLAAIKTSANKFETKLLEVKEVSDPAVGLWTKQPSFSQRHDLLRKALGVSPVLTTIEVGSKKYIVRHKNQEPIESLLEDADSHTLKEWSRVVAYELGRLHAKSTAGKSYVKNYLTDEKQIIEAIENYSTDYLSNVDLTPLRQ